MKGSLLHTVPKRRGCTVPWGPWREGSTNIGREAEGKEVQTRAVTVVAWKGTATPGKQG